MNFPNLFKLLNLKNKIEYFIVDIGYSLILKEFLFVK